MSRALLCFVPLALAAACGDDTSEVAATGGTAGSGGNAGGGGGSGGDASVDAPACPSAPTLHTFVALGPSEQLLNPGRGFHDFVDLASTDDFQGVRAAGRTLAYAGVSLLDYLDAPIPSGFLSQLSAGLDRVRSAKIKVILRFVYRNDMAAPNDAKLTRILEHIQTLGPLLKQHADVIAVLEAGFIGPWGEWHSSSNGLDTDAAAKKAILDALLAATPPDMFVLVRRWSFKHDHAGGPVTAAQAFDGTPVSRLGHHNDCFLASDDDMGTYPFGQAAAWKALIGEDTRFVPIGGETCADYPARTTCKVAVPEMSQLRWSFLNAVYHPAALARFQSEGCYDEISSRLGYRLVLESATFPETASPGCALSLSVKLRNDGFAAPYHARELELILDGPTHFVAKLPVDPRRFDAGSHAFDVSVPLPESLPSGSYSLALRLPDPAPALRDIPEYAVRFANATGWDATTGTNLLFADLSLTP
ncbi:MAG: DUF4832 domain-containing protein [Myxococcales bacterium]|nr:DUF4832 domain-containing protein [Myxococcales bacterium]